MTSPGAATGAPQELSASVALRVLGGLFLVFWGLRLYSGTFFLPGSELATPVFVAVGLGCVVLALTPLGRRHGRAMDIAVLVFTGLAMVAWLRLQLYLSPTYGTDEIALDQAAAEALLRGLNPYSADLSRSLSEFAVTQSALTNTLSGQTVGHLSYPALSFLVYVPGLLFGANRQVPVAVDGAFWIAGMVALWLALPGRLRALAPLIGSLDFYIFYVSGGISDALMAPFLVGALWRWDRFSDAGVGRGWRWLGPVSLGLACSVKQSAWVLVPFLCLGVALEARDRWRSAAQYLALVAVPFLLVNLPFVAWDPVAWVRGAGLPVLEPLVPLGQGAVAATLYLNAGGGNLKLYSAAAAAAILALGLALARWYRPLKPVLPLLPLLALLLNTRSLSNYFVFLVPGLLVAAATIRPGRAHIGRGARPLALAATGLGLVAAVCVVGAWTWPAPLAVNLVGVHSTGQGQSFDTLRVEVHNRSGRGLSPLFAVSQGPFESGFWTVHQGPFRLEPGASATYVLWAPNVQSMPSLTEGFEIYAFTRDPDALSASRVIPPGEMRTHIEPGSIDRPVRPGETVRLAIQVEDRLGAPVRTAGIEVFLGQSFFSQEGLFNGETSINGESDGKTPVYARTDGAGVAHFEVVAHRAQVFPVFYQAWLVVGYPQGYSNQVEIRSSS